jgi:hypothetical protein
VYDRQLLIRSIDPANVSYVVASGLAAFLEQKRIAAVLGDLGQLWSP